jgi:hypothetical protein
VFEVVLVFERVTSDLLASEPVFEFAWEKPEAVL